MNTNFTRMATILSQQTADQSSQRICKALTNYQHIVPSATMITDYYKDIIAEVCGIKATEKMLTTTEALDKTDAGKTLKKAFPFAWNTINGICRIARTAYQSLIIAADIDEVHSKGYTTIMQLASTENYAKVAKYNKISIPVLQGNYYTGTVITLEADVTKDALCCTLVQQTRLESPLVMYLPLNKATYAILTLPNTSLAYVEEEHKAFLVTGTGDNVRMRDGSRADTLAEFLALIHLVLSQLDTVVERTTIERHNNRVTTTVMTAHEDEFRFVPVVRYKYIPKERVNHGGTHASPREHERMGHYRHYKSGKVVYIKPMTINRGKTHTMYKATIH